MDVLSHDLSLSNIFGTVTISWNRLRFCQRISTHVVVVWPLQDQEEGIMPSYFKFLTVLAFSIFLKEKVSL